MELATQRLLLRPWRLGDEDALVRQADDPRISQFLRDRFPNPYRREHADFWISQVATQEPTLDFAIVLDGQPIGGVGLETMSDVYAIGAELGYWLGVRHWGRGYATEAVAAITDYAFATLELLRVQAAVYAPNVGSARVLEKCGYAREGTLRRAASKRGAVLDVHLYARVR